MATLGVEVANKTARVAKFWLEVAKTVSTLRCGTRVVSPRSPTSFLNVGVFGLLRMM